MIENFIYPTIDLEATAAVVVIVVVVVFVAAIVASSWKTDLVNNYSKKVKFEI